MGFFGRIREGLSRTTRQIVDRFDEIVDAADAPDRRSRPVDVETIDALEELLISADIGVPATNRIIAAVRTQSRNGASLRDLVKQEIRQVFAAVDRPIAVTARPQIVLIVGVATAGALVLFQHAAKPEATVVAPPPKPLLDSAPALLPFSSISTTRSL